MTKPIATFEAKCSSCGGSFEHPSLGDFAYGEAVLTTCDGKHHAWVSAFEGLPNKVGSLIDNAGVKKPGVLWEVLASLADPIDGQTLSPKLSCPHCASTDLAFWSGTRIASKDIPEVSFLAVAELDEAALSARVSEVLRNA